jgi:hypothetical protein
VIHKWLTGDQRDKIAVDIRISPGAASNIIGEWRNDIGSYAADELRSFAVSLRKIGLTLSGCVVGLRVAMILKRLGVLEDKFESFMSAVYNCYCSDLGITPERIGSYITNPYRVFTDCPLFTNPSISSKRYRKKREWSRKYGT